MMPEFECALCGGRAFLITPDSSGSDAHVTAEGVTELLHAIRIQVFGGKRARCSECSECFLTPSRILSSVETPSGRLCCDTRIKATRLR